MSNSPIYVSDSEYLGKESTQDQESLGHEWISILLLSAIWCYCIDSDWCREKLPDSCQVGPSSEAPGLQDRCAKGHFYLFHIFSSFFKSHFEIASVFIPTENTSRPQQNTKLSVFGIPVYEWKWVDSYCYRRLLRSPRAADADAAGSCRPLSAPLPGGTGPWDTMGPCGPNQQLASSTGKLCQHDWRNHCTWGLVVDIDVSCLHLLDNLQLPADVSLTCDLLYVVATTSRSLHSDRHLNVAMLRISPLMVPILGWSQHTSSMIQLWKPWGLIAHPWLVKGKKHRRQVGPKSKLAALSRDTLGAFHNSRSQLVHG